MPRPWKRVKTVKQLSQAEAVDVLASATAEALATNSPDALNVAVEIALSAGLTETHPAVRNAADLIYKLQKRESEDNETGKPVSASAKGIDVPLASKRYHQVSAQIEMLEQKRRVHLAAQPLAVQQLKTAQSTRKRELASLSAEPEENLTRVAKAAMSASTVPFTFLELLDATIAAKRNELTELRLAAGHELQTYLASVFQRLKKMRAAQAQETTQKSMGQIADLQWQFPSVKIEKVPDPAVLFAAVCATRPFSVHDAALSAGYVSRAHRRFRPARVGHLRVFKPANRGGGKKSSVLWNRISIR